MSAAKLSSYLSNPKRTVDLDIVVEAKCNDCKSDNIAIVSYFKSLEEEEKE